MEFHFGFFYFPALPPSPGWKEGVLVSVWGCVENGTWQGELDVKGWTHNQTKLHKGWRQSSKSGCAHNNWTAASFSLSTLGRVLWELNHCQMVFPVSSLLTWVEVNSQYWKEASRTGQSRAERKATGDSCSTGQVGAAFTARRKHRAGEKPFVMLHGEPV